MRILAVFLLVCIVGAFAGTLSDEQKTTLKKFKEDCIKDTGADQTTVDGIQKGGPITRSDSLDCFATCLLKKITILDKEGNVNMEAVKAKAATLNVDQEKVRKVIDKCKDLTGKNECEKGGNIFACFIANKEFPVLD